MRSPLIRQSPHDLRDDQLCLQDSRFALALIVAPVAHLGDRLSELLTELFEVVLDAADGHSMNLQTARENLDDLLSQVRVVQRLLDGNSGLLIECVKLRHLCRHLSFNVVKFAFNDPLHLGDLGVDVEEAVRDLLEFKDQRTAQILLYQTLSLIVDLVKLRLLE